MQERQVEGEAPGPSLRLFCPTLPCEGISKSRGGRGYLQTEEEEKGLTEVGRGEARRRRGSFSRTRVVVESSQMPTD